MKLPPYLRSVATLNFFICVYVLLWTAIVKFVFALGEDRPYLPCGVGGCVSRHPALRSQHGPNAQGEERRVTITSRADMILKNSRQMHPEIYESKENKKKKISEEVGLSALSVGNYCLILPIQLLQHQRWLSIR